MIQLQNIVDAKAVVAKDYFESFNPFSGKPRVLIPKDGQGEVDAAVAATKAACKDEWHNITATVWIDALGETANPFVIR